MEERDAFQLVCEHGISYLSLSLLLRPTHHDPYIEEIFDSMDSDKDGILTPEEIHAHDHVLKKLHPTEVGEGHWRT